MSTLSILPAKQSLSTEICIPGSKSYTIRALMLAALTPGPVTLHRPLFSDDTHAMLNGLRALGIEIIEADDRLEVPGGIQDIPAADYTLNTDLSAASLRFLLALSCVIPGTQTLHGQAGLNRRPVRDLVDALRHLGADIEYLEHEGYPPVRVNSSRLFASDVRISGGVSSQYVSALLMIAPLLKDGITLDVDGPLISRPYVEMTRDIMRQFGVSVILENDQRFIVPSGQAYQAHEYTIEPDASSAAYFWAMAALSRSRITCRPFNSQSRQADMRFLEILQAMGNRVEREPNVLTVHGQGVQPVDVDMQDCPDQVQTLAVLAAFAPGKTRIAGIQSLRLKETDRVAALQAELAKMEIATTVADNTLVIAGGHPRAARIETHGDHRMAMAFAVAGTVLPGMEIAHAEVVNKTFPGFWAALKSTGAGVQDVSELGTAHVPTEMRS